MFNRSYLKRNAGVTGHLRRLRESGINRGQAMVEFTMLAGLALVVMLVGIQYAMIGQAALAVSQGASAIARYAAVNPGTVTSGKASGLPAAAQQLLSPSILTNSGGDLSVTVASLTGSGATETGAIVPTSDQVKITLSYDATSKLALPNPFMAIPPLFPGINFPTTLGATDSQMYE
jgi:Flp pilus assembly protein TadG